MRRLGMVAALLLLVGVLAACQITITYTQPTNPLPATANADSSTPVRSSVSVDPGSTVYFDVLVPSTIRSGYPLVYFELHQNLDLVLKDYSSYAPLASSSSASYFASGSAGLQSLSSGAGVAPQTISVNYNCYGSCIIWPTGATSHYYLGVENTGTAPVTFDLYVYGYGYQDPYEPGNNSSSQAVQYSGGAESGAIETLGDADWWQITGANGTLTFSKVSSPVGLELVLRASDMSYVDTYYVGGSYASSTAFSVRNGDYLEVQSANGRAGPTGVSLYNLNY